jgi:hypothetical protein
MIDDQGHSLRGLNLALSIADDDNVGTGDVLR